MPLTYPFIKTDRGVHIALIEKHLGFSYTKRLNGPGWFSITVPGDLDLSTLEVDRQIQFWREDTINQPTLDFLGFLRKWSLQTGPNGERTITLSGPDQNELIARRIVAYAADTSQAETSYVGTLANYPADSSMIDVVNENMGASATADRDLSGYSFTVRLSQDLGPDVVKSFAWRNLDRVLSELNIASRLATPETFWELGTKGVDADGTVNLEFSVFNSPPGGDRAWAPTTLAKPMIFGLRWGNLRNPTITYDYSDEVNFVYAGGAGEGADREIVTVEDVNRSAASIWNRREAFVDARNEKNTAAVTDKANQVLEAGRPKIIFSGSILSNEQTPYGEWGLGSRVTIEYFNRQFNGIVRTVTVSVRANEEETVQSSVKFESAV